MGIVAEMREFGDEPNSRGATGVRGDVVAMCVRW